MNTSYLTYDLAAKLAPFFSVQSVKATIIDSSKFRQPIMRDKEVTAFEFIINSTERYTAFAMEAEWGVVFTRPKEGIVDYLIADVRSKDFYFKLTDNVYGKYDLVGRLIENYINATAAAHMHEIVLGWQERASVEYNYCLGYKITRHHKDTMSFDGVFEVLVNKKDSDYTKYTIHVTDGNAVRVFDHQGDECPIKHIFG